MGQGVTPPGPNNLDTSGTSAEESEANHPHWRVRSKQTYEMEKLWGADEVSWFFVNGATDAADKRSQSYCRICRTDGSVLTHGPQKVLRHFQVVKHFARDQRLRLRHLVGGYWILRETPQSERAEAPKEAHSSRSSGHSRSRVSLCRGSNCWWFWIPGATLPVLVKVSSLIEVLRLGGPYELVYQLWSQFTLTASRKNNHVTWSLDEVLVGNILVLVYVSICTCLLVLF